jgi:hypothetical protein
LLIKKILENHIGKDANKGSTKAMFAGLSSQARKGMPLGNLTSQFFANVYLNELDQYIKHKLRAKHYIRYVDDFVILHQSKKILEEYKIQIDRFIKEKLNLTLHPDKSKILKLEKGIAFLGFRIFYHHKLLAKKNMRKFEKKLQQMKHEYQEEKIDREKVMEKLEGWLAYATHANTYKYRRKMLSKFNATFPTQKETTIVSVKKHENFNQKIEASKVEFSSQKTLQLIKNGMSVKQIAEKRGLKEGTIWEHVAILIENHRIKIKCILPNEKVKNILTNIKTPNDRLKEIKKRINDNTISYDEINCVLANLRGKNKKKSITYFVNWYKQINCRRKCYNNKKQRQNCRIKFQQIAAKCATMIFTKNDFLNFINNQTNICILPDKQKKIFVPWKEFTKQLKKAKFQQTLYITKLNSYLCLI